MIIKTIDDFISYEKKMNKKEDNKTMKKGIKMELKADFWNSAEISRNKILNIGRAHGAKKDDTNKFIDSVLNTDFKDNIEYENFVMNWILSWTNRKVSYDDLVIYLYNVCDYFMPKQ